MDKIFLTITLRKEVPDLATGRALFDLVKERMSDRPDVDVRGSASNHYDLDET